LKKIIYIVGTGRSGSTLLCKTLGSHDDAFAISELQYLKNQMQKNRLCSCEKRYPDCPFWTEILSRFPGEGIPSFNMEIDGKRYIKKIKTIYGGDKAENLLFKQEEVDNSIKAYREIFDLSGKDIIIDSGKNVYRALVLSRYVRKEGWETAFIFLIRDGRSVINSYMKTEGKIKLKNGVESQNYPAETFLRSMWGWLKINVRNRRIFNSTMKNGYYHLRYEDFVKDPQETVKDICDFVGMTYNENMLELDRKTHHLIGGAISRVNAKRINTNPVDWSNISKFQMLLFHLFAGWFNKKVSRKQ
jgi:hypothetical protein